MVNAKSSEIFNILAIDDDNLILKIVHAACRPFDLRINLVTANSVHEAIDHAKRRKFQFVILDHDLAGVKGWELYDYIKPSLTNDVRVVVYSGGVNETSQAQYTLRGIASILKKPLNANALGFHIRKAIGI